MELRRTQKEINKENVNLDFLRNAVSLGGLHNSPLKAEQERFAVEETFKGVMQGGSVSPWAEHHAKEGYVKHHDGIRIILKGFDCDVRICQNGKIQGYYKESFKSQYAADPIKWVNFLLLNGYLEII